MWKEASGLCTDLIKFRAVSSTASNAAGATNSLVTVTSDSIPIASSWGGVGIQSLQDKAAVPQVVSASGTESSSPSRPTPTQTDSFQAARVKMLRHGLFRLDPASIIPHIRAGGHVLESEASEPAVSVAAATTLPAPAAPAASATTITSTTVSQLGL